MKRGGTTAAVAAAIGMAISFSASALQSYIATPIDVGEVASRATGINANGDITGAREPSSGAMFHAFIYSGSAVIDLGTLGGDGSIGRSISAQREVAGTSSLAANGNTARAFMYAGGALHDLGALGGTFSTGTGINDLGHVVGSATEAGDVIEHAFLYSNGVMVDIDRGTFGLGRASRALGVNMQDQITGQFFTPFGTAHAFSYSSGSMIDLGTLGGHHSLGSGINSIGEIVGESNIANDLAIHGFLYSAGVMHDLGTLGGTNSSAIAINDRGDVVGVSDIAGDTGQHAFIHSNGQMYDLQDVVVSGLSDATLVEASGINNSSQIAATACVGGVLGVRCKAYRLDPVINNPVPTITGNALLAMALMLLTLAVRSIRA